MSNIYKNIDIQNLGKKRKKLIVFEDMIVNMIGKKITLNYLSQVKS